MEEEKIYVFVVEGLVYRCKEEEAQATLTKSEWGNLDRKLQYAISEDALVYSKDALPDTSEETARALPPPLPLDMMYSMEGAGDKERIDALWDLMVKQERTKADAVEEKRIEVRKKHELLTKEYESAQR